MHKRFFGWLLFISMAICFALLVPRIYQDGQIVYGREFAASMVCSTLSAVGLSLARGRRNPTETIRLAQRHPKLLAAFFVMGVCVGAVLVSFDEIWFMVIGVFVLIAYTALLAVISIKLWNRTWVRFCDRLISILDG